MSNNYANKFKGLPDVKLLEITNNSSSYQPEAVDAAKKELANRDLSEEDIDELNADLNENEKSDFFKRRKKLDVKPVQKEFNDQVRDAIKVFAPIGFKSTRDTIQIIAGLFIINGLVAIRSVYWSYEMLKVGKFSIFDLTTFLWKAFILFACVFIGTRLWKFKKFGWEAGMIALIYFLVQFINSTIYAIHWRLTNIQSYDGLLNLMYDYYPPILPCLFYILLISFPIGYFYQKRVRVIFGIELESAKTLMLYGILGSIVLVCLNYLTFYL